MHGSFQVGESEDKIRVERPEPGWQNNIKMNLKDEGCGGVNRVQWWAVVSTGLNLGVPQTAGNLTD
jgi:hypothetical protein